jgi:nucleoside-diphosphate-sugar epimerase
MLLLAVFALSIIAKVDSLVRLTNSVSCPHERVCSLGLDVWSKIKQDHSCSLAVHSHNLDENSGKKRAFIFGLGYVGIRLARYLKEKSWIVSGTCTNVNKALEYRTEGIQTYLFDEISVKRGQLEASDDIMSANYIVSTVPPLENSRVISDIVLDTHSEDLRRATLSGTLRWIGYLSSTGVYGDCRGAWVTEKQPLSPDSSKTEARAEVEGRWRSLYARSGLPVHVFRLAGIYGPGRSSLDTLLKARDEVTGSPVDDSTFISRIHVDDIVQGLYASMMQPVPGSIYNVADDLPSTRFEALSYASRLLSFPHVTPASSDKYDAAHPLKIT